MASIPLLSACSDPRSSDTDGRNAAAVSDVSASPRIVSEADNGQRIELRVGDTFVVRLPENQTSGFRWKVDQLDPAILSVLHDEYTPPRADAPGAGGQRTLELRGQAPGQTRLMLQLASEWKRETPGSKFELSVDVTR